MSLDRREFLINSGLTVLSSSLLFLPLKEAIAQSSEPSTVMASIAEAYLKATGDTIGISEAKKSLTKMNQKQQIQWLQAQSSQNYLEDKIFYYKGWILSHSEGQFCALWS